MTSGYLPGDVPPPARMFLLGLQQVIAMFPATILVALLVGFDVGTVLVMSGIATIMALISSRLFSGRFIPLYYGSSFSYIAATLAVTGASFGEYAGADLVSLAQVGFVATGLFNILAGFMIKVVGKEVLDRFLPSAVTGGIAIVIGVALSKVALDMAFANFGLAVVTFSVMVLASVYLRNKGLIGMLPVLMAAVVGYVVAVLFGLVDMSPVAVAPWLVIPRFTLPAFGHPLALGAAFSIGIMAIATIPESTAHLYQISLYSDKLADEMGKKRPDLKSLVGLNLILDGLGDLIGGLFGGVAGTNYGENNSLMAVTKNYSGPVLIAAGVMAIFLGFVGKLSALVGTIPVAVTGGLAIYLFGVIAVQGIALIQAEKVDLFGPRNLAIVASMLVVGVGGHIGFAGGNLPLVIPGLFPGGIPAIVAAAVVGILLNFIFEIFPVPSE